VKVWCSSGGWSLWRWFPYSPDPVLLSEGDPLSVRIGTARATAVDHGGLKTRHIWRGQRHCFFDKLELDELVLNQTRIVFFSIHPILVCHLLSLNQTRFGWMESNGWMEKIWKNLDDRKPFRSILDVRFLGVKSPAFRVIFGCRKSSQSRCQRRGMDRVSNLLRRWAPVTEGL